MRVTLFAVELITDKNGNIKGPKKNWNDFIIKNVWIIRCHPRLKANKLSDKRRGKKLFNGLGCESDQVIPNFYNRWGVEKPIKINKNINEHLFVSFDRSTFFCEFSFPFSSSLIETNYLSIECSRKTKRRIRNYMIV